MQEILIANIRTDGGVQSRAAINPEYVAELAEIIKASVKLPPIDVYRDPSGAIWAADGFHRIRAHEAAGVPNIRANVHKGSKQDAEWHSCGANVAHGLRRTNADKQRAVEMALATRPTASDALIADHCGVSHTTVANRRRIVQPAKLAGCPRTGADGKVRQVPPSRPKPPQKPAESQVVPPSPPSQKREMPEPDVGADGPVDALGNEIPDYLRDSWDRSTGVIRDIVGTLRNVRTIIAHAQESGDGVFLDADLQAIHAALSTALSLKASAPYAVCPWCQGGPTRKTCDGCRGAGMIGKHRYDTAVPSELK